MHQCNIINKYVSIQTKQSRWNILIYVLYSTISNICAKTYIHTYSVHISFIKKPYTKESVHCPNLLALKRVHIYLYILWESIIIIYGTCMLKCRFHKGTELHSLPSEINAALTQLWMCLLFPCSWRVLPLYLYRRSCDSCPRGFGLFQKLCNVLAVIPHVATSDQQYCAFRSKPSKLHYMIKSIGTPAHYTNRD